MTEFLLLKTEIKLDGMSITTGKGVKLDSPMGIASEFLTNGKNIDKESWMRLTQLRAKVNADNAQVARGNLQ